MKGSNLLSGRRARVLGATLLGVHGGLALWAAAGLAELVEPERPWPAVTNPELPAGIRLVHWLAMLGAGSVFVVGYLRRWPATPRLMVYAYAGLATVCAVETFGHLTNTSRFVDMAVEYGTYGVLVVLLHKTPLNRRFWRVGADRRRAPLRGSS